MADITTSTAAAPAIGAGRRDLQLVTFRLGEWEFGADVTEVGGIYHGLPMIPTPDAPDAIAGDIQISGERISVLRLSHLFGQHEATRNGNWWIIVLNLLDGPIGLMVDKVTEVVRLEANLLRAPYDKHHPAKDYVTAVANRHGRAISLLDYSALARELLK